MSDDETYRIIGKVVSDHADAKRHLAALQIKNRALIIEINDTQARIAALDRQCQDLGVQAAPAADASSDKSPHRPRMSNMDARNPNAITMFTPDPVAALDAQLRELL